MLGIIRRRKPIVHTHWIVPLFDFQSDQEQFYEAIEGELKTRRVPEIMVERIDFKQGSVLMPKRTYLRLRREREVMDICSAPYGTSWWFSLRFASLPRLLYWWEVWVCVLGLVGSYFLYQELYGDVLGRIVLGSSVGFLLLAFFTARAWAGLDEFLIYLPVVGAIYEAYFRRDSYYRQDQRLISGALVTAVVRGKVIEFCAAGGVSDPPFENVSNPEQILSIKELAKYLGKATDKP